MPRRNNRVPHQPLDLTPPEQPRSFARREPTGPRPYWAKPVEDPYLRRLREERERADRQAEARKRDGIDWSVCLVPGCGGDLRNYMRYFLPMETRDPDRVLPLCDFHAAVAWRQMQNANGHPEVMRTTVDIDRELRERAAAREAAEAEKRKADRNGHMYFVRINDLIKVGWTQNLARRFKEYGAGAEVLCHYPAHAGEEAPLHRELKPSRAKGREWYHDNDVLRLHISNAIQRHGHPTVEADWTVPENTAQPIRPRSGSRGGYYGGVAQR